MTKSTLALGIAFSLLAGSAVFAEESLDVSKVSCAQFVESKASKPKYMGIWISGYYYGTQKKVVVDTDRLVDNAEKLQSFCKSNPKMPVLEAVDKVLGPLP